VVGVCRVEDPAMAAGGFAPALVRLEASTLGGSVSFGVSFQNRPRAGGHPCTSFGHPVRKRSDLNVRKLEPFRHPCGDLVPLCLVEIHMLINLIQLQS